MESTTSIAKQILRSTKGMRKETDKGQKRKIKGCYLLKVRLFKNDAVEASHVKEKDEGDVVEVSDN